MLSLLAECIFCIYGKGLENIRNPAARSRRLFIVALKDVGHFRFDEQ